LSYRYTKDRRYLDAALRLARKFNRELNGDDIPVWDFRLPPGIAPLRDTSAAAVAVCGLGYVIDEATRLLLVHGTRMATVTFIGEVALMFWLIILAARGRD
jgi:hypothetical protein